MTQRLSTGDTDFSASVRSDLASVADRRKVLLDLTSDAHASVVNFVIRLLSDHAKDEAFTVECGPYDLVVSPAGGLPVDKVVIFKTVGDQRVELGSIRKVEGTLFDINVPSLCRTDADHAEEAKALMGAFAQAEEVYGLDPSTFCVVNGRIIHALPVVSVSMGRPQDFSDEDLIAFGLKP